MSIAGNAIEGPCFDFGDTLVESGTEQVSDEDATIESAPAGMFGLAIARDVTGRSARPLSFLWGRRCVS